MVLEQLVTAPPISRRRLLGALGMAGVATVLGACGGARASPAPRTGPPAASGAPATSGTPAASGATEGALALCAWPDDVNPDTIDRFKARFGITSFHYDTCVTGEELAAMLGAASSGIDVATPAAGQVPRLVEAGLIRKLDRSRIPTARHISSAFRGLAWDPTDTYQVPKDYGTTGILYRGALVREPLTTWREFRALVTSSRYSGRSVFVDSMDDVLAFPLKLLGASVNTTLKRELGAARSILLEVAPHVLALDSTGYGERLRTGEAVLALGSPAPLATLRADSRASDTRYVVPGEGTLVWLDTWVLAARAPHVDAAYAWLDFIHEPEVQAGETSYTGHATPNDAAKALVDPALLADPAIFPPADVLPRLECAVDTSASAQRVDIWQEFRAKVREG